MLKEAICSSNKNTTHKKEFKNIENHFSKIFISCIFLKGAENGKKNIENFNHLSINGDVGWSEIRQREKWKIYCESFFLFSFLPKHEAIYQLICYSHMCYYLHFFYSIAFCLVLKINFSRVYRLL